MESLLFDKRSFASLRISPAGSPLRLRSRLKNGSSSGSRCLSTNAGVGQRVEEISHEVHGYVSEADHEDAALDEIVVAAADGADGEAADSGPGKNCFGNNGSGEQRAKLKSDHGEHRHHGMAQRVLVHHHTF